MPTNTVTTTDPAWDIPAVASPYEGKRLRIWDHLAISAYWFATNFLWGAMLEIMLPKEMRHLAPYQKAEALSILLGLSAVVALVVPLITGALSDRCASPLGRRRPYIITGVAINLIGLAGMGFALHFSHPIPGSVHQHLGFWRSLRILCSNSGFEAMLVTFMVVQLGNNVASAAYSGIIPDVVPREQRGQASGYMAMLTQLGTLVGVLTAGVLMGDRPEWMKYCVIGVVLAGVSLVTVLGVKETPLPVAPPRINWAHYVKSLWIDPRKYPDFAWVWITRALVMLGFYAILPYVNYYLQDVILVPVPEASAAKLIGALLLASSLSGLAGGYISDRIGRKRVVYIANCIIAASSLLFIWCRNMEQVFGAGVMFGIGFGAYISVDWALGTDVLPSKKDAAKEMAVWHIAMTLPQSLSGPAAAFLISSQGMTEQDLGVEKIVHYTLAGYTNIFLLCAICFALGAYLLKNVKSVR